MTHQKKLAIVGMGPRGTHALENFLQQFSGDFSKIHILLFEETPYIGYGQVYNIKQAESNWINISERILIIEARNKIDLGEKHVPQFPSYHQWANKDYSVIPKNEADNFPPRSNIGHYFHERFQSLLTILQQEKLVTVINARVDLVNVENEQVIIKTNTDLTYTVDEVLLTIGHQPTKKSEQITKWETFAATNNQVQLFTSPYPVEQFINSEAISHDSIIGLRGFGLAMMDVVRGIAEKFGNFKLQNEKTRAVKYETNLSISNLFVPFSLDGLPMSPKPLNAQIDQWYKPSKEEIATFEKTIGDPLIQQKATSPLFLIEAIAPIVSNRYLNLPQATRSHSLTNEALIQVITSWLQSPSYQHPTIIPRTQSAEITMQEFVQMAIGSDPVSLDFCIGQVWRHCQSSMYDRLSFHECSEETFAKVIELDERIKRYSYGPPVESIQQLIALVSAGVLNLTFVNDPEIALKSNGWKLSAKNTNITATIMINSVLDSPELLSVDAPIIKNLLANDLIQAVHDDLGIFTDENGYVISNDNRSSLPIAVLGRLAKGTIIGVDAILECFGSRPKQWAVEAAKRLGK